ncbi:MAG: hypothetical protein O2967_09770 [Proteobacteria bacterium]|nr:hypothetical protein [Pseudomonadota bacterium]
MKQINLMTAVFVVAAILLAAHSFHNEYADLPLASRWLRTTIYGFGPWLCAAAFAGAKVCFQILLHKEPNFRTTFHWVTGVVIALMLFTKFIAA